jgi:hypothetical protein
VNRRIAGALLSSLSLIAAGCNTTGSVFGSVDSGGDAATRTGDLAQSGQSFDMARAADAAPVDMTAPFDLGACKTAGDCPLGFACDPTSGACTTTCSATAACHGGCCSTGKCQPGNTPTACGGASTQCLDCSAASVGHACVAGNCGCANDGDCPAGTTCGGGGGTPTVCGCTPKTCQQQNFNCGMASDGCGNTINCGACPAGQTCGGGGMPNVCGCQPMSCQQQGFNCGATTDGCNGVISCGACPAGQTCVANVCAGPPCVGLCLQQMPCPNGGTTSVSGSVFAPNGTDVLAGALVYVPNAALSMFTDGVLVPHCSCGSDVSGSPLVSAVTAFDGTFTITNMPVGNNIPLVIQKGRWRRQYTIPNVAACANTALPAAGVQQLRMPRRQQEFTPFDNIPLMAFVTGSVDAQECVLRKIGIADDQFSDPSGTGRVRFYFGSGSPGAKYSAATPSETTLWANQMTIDGYDMVYFACQGNDYEKTMAQQSVVVNYANSGGRVLATHYSYVWLTNTANNATWSATTQWTLAEGAFASDPGVGLINITAPDPRPTLLARWLQFIRASTTYGQIPVNTLRQDFAAVNPPSLLWLSVNDVGMPPFFPGLGNVPLHYTFETPWGVAPANQCGRVAYSDFHVADAATTGTTFPSECIAGPITPQEQMLEFMIFDLGSCVAPTSCVPTTCAASGATCGPIADGCGNVLQCGSCPSGQSCVGGRCATTCAPQSCASQGFTCGKQGDGCGNLIDCGSCATGQCHSGMCSPGACTPLAQCPVGITCGMIGDGCSSTLDCGSCPAGQTCGGGGTPNQCGAPACVPKTCAQQGFTCGMATDGCNNVINCGACAPPQSCGAGLTPQANVCGGISGI